MKTAWVALYNNMDGDFEIIAVSESLERLELAMLQRIEEIINNGEELGYDRYEENDQVVYRVGDKYFSDETGMLLDFEPFEWYTLTKYELLV